MPRPRTRIAIVTPWPWNVPHPVNDHVAEVADGLRLLQREDADAPDVVVVAPSGDLASRRRTRHALRELGRGVPAEQVLADPELDAPAPGARKGEPVHDWPLLAVAPSLAPVSVAVRSGLNLVLERAEVDVLVVHDPLEGDLGRLAARRWHGLTLGVFHEAPAPALLTLLPSGHRESVLDAIDRWIVPAEAAGIEARLAEALGRIPADVATMPTFAAPAPGLDPELAPGGERLRAEDATAPEGPPLVVITRGAGDDAALRLLVRELARAAADNEFELVVLGRWGRHHRPTPPRALKGRMRTQVAATRAEADALLARAAVAVALPGAHHRAVAEASGHHVPVVEVDGDDARLEQEVAAAAAAALGLLRATGPGERTPVPTSPEVASALLEQVAVVRARRQPEVHIPGPIERPCFIDLHMHTNHSWDCATEPEMLLYAAREAGLTAIAVTDHNEISGALACAELADEYGVQVVVGEEVMTEAGEVIGLFLRERIEPGLSWEETIARIRAQDGIVYVPHPFDRLHTIPDVATLRATIEDIDAFETYNSRLAFERFNRDAERFARKYNLIEGAGSDAHVPQGLGTAGVRMPGFDDPETFLTALRQGELVRRPKSLLYLQGLKRMHQVAGRAGTGKDRD